MACKRCRNSKTIRAHLIPRVLAREVQVGTAHATGVSSKGEFHPTQSGTFDTNLLCARCDNQLGKLEHVAAITLKTIRSAAVGKPLHAIITIPSNPDPLVRFYAAMLWKYGSTRMEFGRIELGPYTKDVEHIAFDRKAIPSFFDVALFRLRFHSVDDGVFNYRMPKLDRKHGVNLYRLFVGGVLAFIKVDQRCGLNPGLESLWLRTASKVSAIIEPAQHYEEFRDAKRAIENNAGLSRFLDSQESFARNNHAVSKGV